MKTYSINYEREAYLEENLTEEQFVVEFAKILCDDQRRFCDEDDVDFESLLEWYYIDLFEDGEEIDGSRADLLLNHLNDNNKLYNALKEEFTNLGGKVYF